MNGHNCFFWKVTFLWFGEEDGKPIFSKGFVFFVCIASVFQPPSGQETPTTMEDR